MSKTDNTENLKVFGMFSIFNCYIYGLILLIIKYSINVYMNHNTCFILKLLLKPEIISAILSIKDIFR